MKQMPHFPRIPRIPATNQTPRHKSRYAIRGTPYGNSRARNRRSHLEEEEEEEGREGLNSIYGIVPTYYNKRLWCLSLAMGRHTWPAPSIPKVLTGVVATLCIVCTDPWAQVSFANFDRLRCSAAVSMLIPRKVYRHRRIICIEGDTWVGFLQTFTHTHRVGELKEVSPNVNVW